jgi:nucleoside 2-deoxyribosyltransferase
MCARGCPAFAFSNSTKSHFERVSRFYGDSLYLGDDGRYRGTDGMALENFDMADNLMLDGGIDSRGGTIITQEVEPDRLFLDFTAFEECLRVAAERLLKRAVCAE